jgi:hypothetical protein
MDPEARRPPPEDVWRDYLTALESIDACEARIASLKSWVTDLLEERHRMAQTIAAFRDVLKGVLDEIEEMPGEDHDAERYIEKQAEEEERADPWA